MRKNSEAVVVTVTEEHVQPRRQLPIEGRRERRREGGKREAEER